MSDQLTLDTGQPPTGAEPCVRTGCSRLHGCDGPTCPCHTPDAEICRRRHAKAPASVCRNCLGPEVHPGWWVP